MRCFERSSPQAPKPPQPATQPRFFLDIFAGVHAPVSRAAADQGLDRFQPMDITSHSSHDILLDPVFEALLKLCWSGCIGLIMGAPPCKEYSRLKMKPGGPPPFAPQTTWMGCPTSPHTAQKGSGQRRDHRRGRALLYAVMSRGGIGVLEQPPGSLAWLEPDNHNLFKAFKDTWPGPTPAGTAKTGLKPRVSRATALVSAVWQPSAITTYSTNQSQV